MRRYSNTCIRSYIQSYIYPSFPLFVLRLFVPLFVPFIHALYSNFSHIYILDARMMQILPKCRYLNLLSLSHNPVGDSGVYKLFRSVLSKFRKAKSYVPRPLGEREDGDSDADRLACCMYVRISRYIYSSRCTYIHVHVCTS